MKLLISVFGLQQYHPIKRIKALTRQIRDKESDRHFRDLIKEFYP